MKKVYYSLKRDLAGCKGSSSAIILCSAIMILIIAAVLTDIGYAAVEKYYLVHNAETAARDGIKALAEYEGRDPENYAVRLVKEQMAVKQDRLDELYVNVSDTNRELTVHAEKKFEYLFLKFLGFKSRNFSICVTAKLSGVLSARDVRPFAVKKQDIAAGKQCILSDKPGSGNGVVQFMPLDFGRNRYQDYIRFGMSGQLTAGHDVYILEGATADAARKGVEGLLNIKSGGNSLKAGTAKANHGMAITVPVVGSFNASDGRKMVIEGFAAFLVTGVKQSNGSVLISGEFVRGTVDAATSDSVEDFGLYGVIISRSTKTIK